MTPGDPPHDRRWAVASWVVLILHALSLVALCWQQKLTPDEANYLLAGCILRHDLQWTAYNTVLHGPLAFWPNQLGILVADPSDFVTYAPFGRLGFVPFSTLAAVALARIAKRAFGAKAALGALVLWSTNPLVLAHGCLMTADMALTCTSLWTAERAWRWLAEPTWSRLLTLGIVLGATLATKYLGLLLVPALALVLGTALARGLTPRLLWSRKRDGGLARLADGALAAAVVATVAGVTLHTAYLWQVPGYRVNLPPVGMAVAAEDPAFGPKSTELRSIASTSAGRAVLALLPEPWIRGTDYQRLVSVGLPTFFGEHVAPGFWSYYLVAFGLKLPLIALALFALGLFVRAPRWPRRLPLVAAAAALVPLFFLSGITRLQIGVRYALTAVPFFCLVAGRGLCWLGSIRPRTGRALAAAAVVALVAGAVGTWPRYLSAFNALAPRPYLWFKDSTLDWRADAPAKDRDLAALRLRRPTARVIEGTLGPCLGELLVHGEWLAPRDPRDDRRIYHWLRRFWPVDAVGAWFAFAVTKDSFRAALEADATAKERGRVELAIALLGAGEFEEAAALLRGAEDVDAPRVRAAAGELQSGDAAREAAALLQLGRHDVVIERGASIPRSLRAQALMLSGDAPAVIDLLATDPSPLTPAENYMLAAAYGTCGRAREALALLESLPQPTEAAARATHERILRRLRETVEATARTGLEYLRR